jgi:serine/threonine protein kinase
MLHLAYAVARPHEHFADTIYLSCYGSPCAQADPKRLLLRICRTAAAAGTTCSPEERSIVRQQVVDCLNRAANLTLNDIYEMSDDQESSLGQSQYVQVRAVRKRRTGGDDDDDGTRTCRQRALKIFDKSKFWKAVVKGQERADTIVREISIQATLSAHQCHSSATTHAADVPIVRIYGFFETATEIAIELERLEGTDLFRYVSSKNVLSEAEAARILKDVLTALDTMSSLGVAHRDIKPANILMSSPTSTKDDPRTAVGVKVGDFGMSTFVDVDGLVRGRCGTPGYVAREQDRRLFGRRDPLRVLVRLRTILRRNRPGTQGSEPSGHGGLSPRRMEAYIS